jgi:FlaA1/EpsC-like NDP-sugar epimerase
VVPTTLNLRIHSRWIALHREGYRATMSFLKLEGLHVFVTGAAGGIGSAIVDEFLGK